MCKVIITYKTAILAVNASKSLVVNSFQFRKLKKMVDDYNANDTITLIEKKPEYDYVIIK